MVPVPVSDVDRAKDFYVEQVGFNLDIDRWVADDLRVVQLTPPGSACSIHLTTGKALPGTLQGLLLVVPDVDAARAELAERGVEVSEVVHYENGSPVTGRGEDWNSFVLFSDLDGNSWAVQERSRRAAPHLPRLDDCVAQGPPELGHHLGDRALGEQVGGEPDLADDASSGVHFQRPQQTVG